MNVATPTPVQGQYIVTFDDLSLARDIRKALQMVRGVTSVVRPRKPRLTGYERSMHDVSKGRIHHAESVDDMFRQILGDDYVSA